MISTILTETGMREGHSGVLTQVMANNFKHLDILTKHSPVNRKKKYAAVLSILIKKFENRFQD